MIHIEYLESKQVCRISSDMSNKDWKAVVFQYNQIAEQSEAFASSIEIPWHTFVANINILELAINLYGIEVEFSAKAKALFDQAMENLLKLSSIDSEGSVDEAKIQEMLSSKGFLRTLTNQQARNISKLIRLRSGATFSVPGAGKTTEAIAFFLLTRQSDEGLIVISPKNAFPAWEEQFLVCLGSKSPTVTRLTGGIQSIMVELDNSKGRNVYLITYQQFIRVVPLIANYLQKRRCFVFLDESHRIKGGTKTDTGRQIQRIAHLPIGKLIMSGTPMPNSTIDLVPQFGFLFPEDGDVNEATIVERFRKVYVRTTKKELGLKEPKIIVTDIPLNDPQKRLYDLVRSEELRQLKESSSNTIRLYRQLGKSYMRLLQIVSNPSLLIKTTQVLPEVLREAIEFGHSNKIKYVAFKARQLARARQKVIIWSTFVENVESLTQMLADLGARCIHGGVEAGSEEEENTRENIIKEFHDNDEMFVLVANPAACSEGISLHTVCHHAIYLDRNYNAAQFLQSMDRIHRLGLPPDVETTIEIVKSPKSIDDLVHQRLNEKVRKMGEVLMDESLHIEPITVDLDEDGFDDEDAKLLLSHLKE